MEVEDGGGGGGELEMDGFGEGGGGGGEDDVAGGVGEGELPRVAEGAGGCAVEDDLFAAAEDEQVPGGVRGGVAGVGGGGGGGSERVDGAGEGEGEGGGLVERGEGVQRDGRVCGVSTPRHCARTHQRARRGGSARAAPRAAPAGVGRGAVWRQAAAATAASTRTPRAHRSPYRRTAGRLWRQQSPPCMHSPWWRIAVTRCFVLASSVSTVAIVDVALILVVESSNRAAPRPSPVASSHLGFRYSFSKSFPP